MVLTIQDGGGTGDVNQSSGIVYVAYCWRANAAGTTTSNSLMEMQIQVQYRQIQKLDLV